MAHKYEFVSTGNGFWVAGPDGTGRIQVITQAGNLVTPGGTFTGNVEIGNGGADTFAINAVTTVSTNQKVQFRDTGLYLYSSADGQLDAVADTKYKVAGGTATVETSTTAALALAGTQGYGLDMSGTFTNHMIYIHPTSLTTGKRAIRLGDSGTEISMAAGDGLYRSYAKIASGTDVSAINFLWAHTISTGDLIGTQSQTESWTTVTGPKTVMDHDSIVGIAAGKILAASTATTEGLIGGRYKVYADATSTCNGHVSALWLDNQMSCAVGGTESSIRASTGGSKPDAFAWLTTTSSGWSQLLYLDSTMAAAEPFMATGCSVTVATVPYLKVLVNATQYGIPLIAI